MRRAIAILGLLSGILMLPLSAKAQSNSDSVVNSIMPITWNLSFDNLDSVWNGSLDTRGEYPPDSVIVFNDSTFMVGYGWWYLKFTLDTLDDRISLGYWEGETGTWKVNQIPYLQVGSKVQAAVYCTDASNIAEPPGSPDFCKGGWVTIGGASPPSSVSTALPTPSLSFTSRMLSDYVTLFSFPSDADGSSIRIFDLLGRERDEIRIAPQAQSIEYNTSRLSAGIYIATINGRTTKFTVP